MLWELRIRTPRRIDDVVIETEGETDEEAKRLADAYIASLSSPAIRFIYVRRLIVARSKDFPKGDESATETTRTSRRPTEQPAGRIGA